MEKQHQLFKKCLSLTNPILSVELSTKEISLNQNLEDITIEEISLLKLIILELETKLYGKSVLNNLIIIIIYLFSLMELEKEWIPIDFWQSSEHLISSIEVVLRFCPSFPNWLFQSRPLWTQENLKSLELCLKFYKNWSWAEIWSEKPLYLITGKYYLSLISIKIKILILGIVLIMDKERNLILEIWLWILSNYLNRLEEKMLLLTLSTWSQLMNHVYYHENK